MKGSSLYTDHVFHQDQNISYCSMVFLREVLKKGEIKEQKLTKLNAWSNTSWLSRNKVIDTFRLLREIPLTLLYCLLGHNMRNVGNYALNKIAVLKWIFLIYEYIFWVYNFIHLKTDTKIFHKECTEN